MKTKIKAITYGQLYDVIGRLLKDGKRKRKEALSIPGIGFIQSITDSRTRKTLARGACTVVVEVPPIRLE